MTIEIAYIYFYLPPESTEKENERVLATARSDLFPHLEWMKELISLVILRRGSSSCPKDVFISKFLAWLMREQAPNKLEQVWIDEKSLKFEELGGNLVTGPSIQSFALSVMGAQRFNLHDDRFRHLEHLGGVLIRRFDHLPGLKFIRGRRVRNNDEVFMLIISLSDILFHI